LVLRSGAAALLFTAAAPAAMTATPNFMTGTPNLDLLADVLRRVQLSSAVFLRGEFSEPWAFASTDAATLAAVVSPGARRLVLMHLAVEGSFHIRLQSGESAEAHAGDAVVLPYCDEHSMGFPGDAAPVPIVNLLPAPPWLHYPVVCQTGGGGARTRVLCGYLACEDLIFNPVLHALPRLIHVKSQPGPASEWRQASVRYAMEAKAAGSERSAELLARIPELVLVDCLRQYAMDLPAEQTGWLAALKDPVLSRALVLLHAQPAEPWTVEALARRAAVSRSVLAERFSRTLSVSPIRYLTQWRLQLASDMLRATPLGMAAIAERVGYESEAAFSRAFKRHLGVAPAAWRERA
jgi:AraC-like DNA-binding protein